MSKPFQDFTSSPPVSPAPLPREPQEEPPNIGVAVAIAVGGLVLGGCCMCPIGSMSALTVPLGLLLFLVSLLVLVVEQVEALIRVKLYRFAAAGVLAMWGVCLVAGGVSRMNTDLAMEEMKENSRLQAIEDQKRERAEAEATRKRLREEAKSAQKKMKKLRESASKDALSADRDLVSVNKSIQAGKLSEAQDHLNRAVKTLEPYKIFDEREEKVPGDIRDSRKNLEIKQRRLSKAMKARKR